MKTIFIKELKLTRKSLLIWCAVLLVTLFYGILEYPMVSQNADMIMESMETLPRIVVIMFGVEGISLKTSIDYHLTLYYWVALVAYFHAIITGITVLARDERDKTSEFIYTKPHTRSNLVTAKIITGFVNVSLLTLTTWVGSIYTVYYIDGTMSNYINNKLVIGMVNQTVVGMFLTQIIFFAIGLLLAGLFATYKKALRFGFLIIIITYVLSVIIQFSGNLDYLRILSPFSYFYGLSVATNGIKGLYVILTIAITSISIYFSYHGQQKKDLII